MSGTSGLSAPGSSTYDSSTMYVGDGTWDSSRNDFLLPNLQGLNFATMQYNGMGNRFRDIPEYHVLIAGHGVVAAITFMGIVPAAIFIARFLYAEGRLAYKLHVYLQILTVFLSTVVLVLGWIAVGPKRSLSNPHHGIGLAIYVCILVQFLYGWWWSSVERKRTRQHPTIPLTVYIHRIFGRAVALLAFVEIALGLTLYGSPVVLFVLYSLWGALLIFLYLALEYYYKPQVGSGPIPSAARSEYYSDYSDSHVTGQYTDRTREREGTGRDRPHWTRDVAAGVGALGAYEWWRNRQGRRVEEKERRQNLRPRRYPEESVGSSQLESSVGPLPRRSATPAPRNRAESLPRTHTPGGVPRRSYEAAARPSTRDSRLSRGRDDAMSSPHSWEHEPENEKYMEGPSRRSGNWRDRIIGAGAGIAAFEGVKSLFGGRKRPNDGYVDSQVSSRPSQTDVSRVEAGHAPISPFDARRNRRQNVPGAASDTPTRPLRTRPSGDSEFYDDETSYSRPPRPDPSNDQTLRESIAEMGAIAGFREWNRRRKDRREQEKLDRVRQEQLDNEEQSFDRRNSNRYPRPQDASGRRASLSGTIMTGPTQDPALGSNPELSRTQIRADRPDTTHPPLPATAGAISTGNGGQHGMSSSTGTHQQPQQAPYNIPPPPPGPPPNAAQPVGYHAPQFGSAQMPQGAVEPDPNRLISGHQALQQQHDGAGLHQDEVGTAATEAAAAAVGVAAGASGNQRTQSQSPSRRQGSRTRFRRTERRGSLAAAGSGSQGTISGAGSAGSPPISVKVNMHPDGRHVTLRRLGEEEAAAERAARRRERRPRRPSSLSSGGEETGRYRRSGSIRPSSEQPITNVPPPPAMSNSASGSHRRPSELNLPPALPQALQNVSAGPAQAPNSPERYPPPGLRPAVGPGGSGAISTPPGNLAGTGTDMGTGTDVSAFDSNRRRRRAERARKAQAASGGAKVEFE